MFSIEGIQSQDLHVRFEADGLVTVTHHGDQHVEEDDHVTAGVDPEHQQCPEPREVLHASQLEVVKTDEAEDRPEERLEGLEEV